ncbi:MAG: hypothetical protein M3552_02450 [Planctomycetota bacterium]|nr:hypothetical protein [Planctomycetaceae bacterium]MDQ3329507.1 hypothetical protein [Planctomycetota bacterium]
MSVCQDSVLQARWASADVAPLERWKPLKGAVRCELAIFDQVIVAINGLFDGRLLDELVADRHFITDVSQSDQASGLVAAGPGVDIEDNYRLMLSPDPATPEKFGFVFSSLTDSEERAAVADRLTRLDSHRLYDLTERRKVLKSIAGTTFVEQLDERYTALDRCVSTGKIGMLTWKAPKGRLKVEESLDRRIQYLRAFYKGRNVERLLDFILTRARSAFGPFEPRYLPFFRSQVHLEAQKLSVHADEAEQAALRLCVEQIDHFVRKLRKSSVGGVQWSSEFIRRLAPDSPADLCRALLLSVADMEGRRYFDVREEMRESREDFRAGLLTLHQYIEPLAKAAVDTYCRSAQATFSEMLVKPSLSWTAGQAMPYTVGGGIGASVTLLGFQLNNFEIDRPPEIFIAGVVGAAMSAFWGIGSNALVDAVDPLRLRRRRLERDFCRILADSLVA